MVGGLLVSQVLTLFTTPVIYLFFDRLGPPLVDGPAAEARRRRRPGLAVAMSLSSPFIQRPVATTLLNLSVVLAGAVAFTLLPVSPLPQIDFPVIFVSANLPGASPETMASKVATPLQPRSAPSPGSTSCPRTAHRVGSINVIFDLGKDINVAAREVQAAINAPVLLPSALPGKPPTERSTRRRHRS